MAGCECVFQAKGEGKDVRVRLLLREMLHRGENPQQGRNIPSSVFADTPRYAGEPLSAHLYANESSHKLRMCCPQNPNAMCRRWARLLLHKQELRKESVCLQ